MLAFKLRYLLESSISVLLLFGLFYLALRYFEGQRTSRESLRISLLVMIPELVFVFLGLVLPVSVKPGSALMTTISLSSWFVPVLVFLVLWKVCKFTAGRALLFAVIYLLLGFLAGLVYMILRPLLPPWSGEAPGRRAMRSFLQLSILLIPVAAWGLTRFLGIKVSPLAGSFLVALLFSPVPVVGHGFIVIPAFLVWMGMFMGGNVASSTEFGYMFMAAIVSVMVSTFVILILYSLAQRLRVMPAPTEP